MISSACFCMAVLFSICQTDALCLDGTSTFLAIWVLHWSISLCKMVYRQQVKPKRKFLLQLNV